MTIEIDGSQGEGGGQILRTALSLSIITGQAIQIKNIRAKRKTPGLMRQHLTAVHAAATICGASVEGDFAGSTQLSFIPGTVQGGDYRFSIGTAGSCTLVLQTILLPLLTAAQDSRIVLCGGTHNTLSPPFHFLQRAFLPLLALMGAQVELQLNRFGFYPAGGGELVATITAGDKLKPLHLLERGERLDGYAESFFTGLPAHIAQRELAIVKQKLGWRDDQLFMREIPRDQGPGNVLLITLQYANVCEVFTGFAERGVAAETVAKGTVSLAQHYLTNSATVGAYFADQLLLPLALAGGGTFSATEWSLHAATNAAIIELFLPIRISMERTEHDGCLVSIRPKS